VAERSRRGARPPAAPADPGAGARRDLNLALAVAVLIPAASAGHLALAYLVRGGAWRTVPDAGLPVLLLGNLVLGLALIVTLYRSRQRIEARTGDAPPRSTVEAPGQPGQPGEGLQALLASERTDEVGALMREFTRILEVLQEQASQVQDYAGRFEAINEELRNANLRLRELSLTDELTEVGNRRNFDVRIREEINRSTRFGHAFSLLLLDIDQFKAFNDEYGHPQGDAVLRGLGALMRSMSREGDVPCRIGGEEFAFILPETVKPDALAFAERMRRGVEATIMAPDRKRPITISIGLAAFPEDGKSPEDLLRSADEALYESKRTGRNRVTAYLRK
jgi:diguanylate cyclase (GGDEF)-like protein